MRSDHIFPVDAAAPEGETIEKAAALLNRGGLVVFPTSSFYGLGAKAYEAEAVGRIFKVKKRDLKKPLLILIASREELGPLIRSMPEEAGRLADAFWPGSLTLVFEAADVLSPNLTGHTGKIGIRLAGHPVALSLVESVGSPITGTSANVSGKQSCTEVGSLDPSVGEQVDMILDAGPLPGGKGSSVVDVTVSPPRILREGTISAAAIGNALERRIGQ
jgi:L-threonylcarbamoyladenylate synthase